MYGPEAWAVGLRRVRRMDGPGFEERPHVDNGSGSKYEMKNAEEMVLSRQLPIQGQET